MGNPGFLPGGMLGIVHNQSDSLAALAMDSVAINSLLPQMQPIGLGSTSYFVKTLN
jgi:hypothetical protein